MFKKILFGLFVFFLMAIPGVQAADMFQNLEKTRAGAGFDPSQTSPLMTISLIIQIALSFLGVIFLILTIYGGFLWMTAGGDNGKVDEAKKMITAAIIGLIIIVSAYAVSYFVIDKLITSTLS